MCGILGVVSSEGDVSQDLYAGLWSLQHRGKESAGIITFDGQKYNSKRGMGTVEVVFGNDGLSDLDGRAGVGHVRYSTTGSSSSENIQPIEGSFKSVPFWVSHNGNFTNTEFLRRECEGAGYFFKTKTDTEILAALIFLEGQEKYMDFERALKKALSRIDGTYSLVILYKDAVYGMVDASANRPLVYGRGRGIQVLASESATCDVLGIKYLRDVNTRELIILNSNEPRFKWDRIGYQDDDPSAKEKFCIFEYVYFLRPDSVFDGRRAQSVRERMGAELWEESPVDADIVVPVPDSGNFAASGLAQKSGLPLVMALFRSHYVGRTFIEPLQERREKGMRIKLNIIPELVQGKRVVVVDDSIVRSTVIKRVISQLKEAGAEAIHVRISSPPYQHPCYYGIDTYRVENELIARRHAFLLRETNREKQGYCGNGSITEHLELTEMIRQEIGADSLHYLSLAGLKLSVLNMSGRNIDRNSRFVEEKKFCDACFSGNYPIPLIDKIFGEKEK